MPLDRAHEGAAAIAFSRWRGEELPLDGGGLLINDAYNANPMSMRAALDHLADRAGSRRRVAVLEGDVELVQELFDVLLTVGPLAQHYGDQTEIRSVRSVAGVDEAIAALDELLQPGDCVLVKASRSVGLEVVAEALAGARV